MNRLKTVRAGPLRSLVLLDSGCRSSCVWCRKAPLAGLTSRARPPRSLSKAIHSMNPFPFCFQTLFWFFFKSSSFLHYGFHSSFYVFNILGLYFRYCLLGSVFCPQCLGFWSFCGVCRLSLMCVLFLCNFTLTAFYSTCFEAAGYDACPGLRGQPGAGFQWVPQPGLIPVKVVHIALGLWLPVKLEAVRSRNQ